MRAFMADALWPAFEDKTEANRLEYERVGGRALLIDVEGESPVNPQLTAAKRMSVVIGVTLENMVGPAEVFARSDGLTEHRATGIRPGYVSNASRSDYFVSEGDGVHIFCPSALGLSVGSSAGACNQYWIYRGLLVRVNYYKWLLPDWRTVREKVEAYLNTLSK